ncbi:MAG: branched-chain amino acid ABC transporter permease [Candidatus Buchananbacteria bacterium CG10_big_fil_rev_8_21_14_0_10_42_9]|uniref:Branched-chain amino acid ABC transporter permease n=1 Tax=Candidatus Buchananbacteria bacterium CG10_big_fil_rev_8_21_14_0_10_42_9 TaxID=1974526 RepID=A0A2H0W2P0_9BACT|nr:MAG: branched-chain amino acid ABC transporter permease [Candidatus Buchananbacteria bacterium CG10_big_fil_rev_8_21_14_0_10_42_9]
MEIFVQLLINGIIAAAIYSLIAVSFNLNFGVTKFFNLAHASFAGIGAYTVFYLLKWHDFNTALAIIIGIFFAGFVGYLSDKFVFLPLRKKKASNMILLVASLGVWAVIESVLAILFSNQFQTIRNNTKALALYHLGPGVITFTQVVMIFISVLVIIGLLLLFKFTQFGKAIKAIGDDEEVAKIVGIDTDKIIGYTFFLGTAIAGLGGILIGFESGVEPTWLATLLKGIIAAMIGGLGTITGGALGSLLLGLVENFGIWKVSGEWKDAIAFALLIVFLIFRPRGMIKR